MTMSYALALHGGAGPIAHGDHQREERHMSGLIVRGRDMLAAGADALAVVEALTADLEACGLYTAGRGSAPNTDGVFELDAAIMDGHARRAGAVAALTGYVSPIAVARAVMERTPHVLLVSRGAEAFAEAENFAAIPQPPEAYYTPSSRASDAAPDTLAHGTVGVVARDAQGRLAAATSTGGVFKKRPGRVGDSALIGAGTWADERVAVSCTGQGEFFMRAAVAADISARMRYGGQTLQQAADGALEDMRVQGGEGGLIAVDAQGALALPFTSAGMRRAWLDAEGAPQTDIF